MNWLKKHLSPKPPATPSIYAGGVFGFADAMDRSFQSISGRPRDPQHARAEYAAFAITLGTMALVGLLPEEGSKKQEILDAINKEAIDYLVSSSWIKDRSALEYAVGNRYEEYSFEISYEIFKAEGDNVHGGPMFAFASVMANAYGMQKTKTPLTKITGQLEMLLGALTKAIESAKRAVTKSPL